MNTSEGISVDFEDEEDDENYTDVPTNSEIPRNEKTDTQHLMVVPKPSMSIPVSLLIESLVKNICTIYESDQQKAENMYKVICDKLYNMNLLGESYSMNEFEGMRSQYQRALMQLLSSVKGGDKSLPLSPIWPKSEFNSHYHREFDEVEFIAGGGFGQVIYIFLHKTLLKNTSKNIQSYICKKKLSMLIK